ncbi:MAG TPA: peptidoglycan editing factor PgeF [Nocardioidaceae bacterium]|nr:peptidoglycan editing factor PgeF [Nocardioidaceae bacterium]
MFSFQETRGVVEVAFTDRHGGVSGGPYASLNLAEPKADGSVAGRAEVEQNLQLLVRAFTAAPDDAGGSPERAQSPLLVRMHQVHGADVQVVDRAWLDAMPAQPPVADGLVTDLPGVVLLVRVADCVPLLLADLDQQVVGVAHAGRPGLVEGIVPNTVAGMRDLGARHIVAWLGPHVCGRCYEVPAAMREEVAAVVPESFAQTSWGTPAVDVGAGVVAQLNGEGVEVVDASRCTLEDPDLYSYRRQGAASGRLGGLVWIRP